MTHLERSFLGALQDIAALIWMAFVYALKGVLLLVEWAFSLDLLGQAMTGARRTLAYLHDEVIGQPWFLAALSVAGLWGIWRGFVKRQATQAITGLIASVLLMVAGLVILARPEDTVGRASQLANQASLSVLSAATGRDINRPTRSLADSMIGVFDSMVRDPWCALEFGSHRVLQRSRRRTRTAGRTRTCGFSTPRAPTSAPRCSICSRESPRAANTRTAARRHAPGARRARPRWRPSSFGAR